MLSLSLYKVNFDELNINNLSKRALLDSLRKFWTNDDYSYLAYLEKLNINYYQKFTNIFELNNNLNEEIQKINKAIAEENTGHFNFKAINLLKSKNLKEINDNEYYKFNIDLRHLNDNSKINEIKDIFLNTDSVSLVDFKEVEDERISLIYHKKGAFIYNDEFLLNTSRDKINLLENFKVAKDNNFIIARFILDLAKNLKEAGINEDFAFSYEIGNNKKEIIKNIDEIIFWGNLNAKEKEEEKAKIKLREEQEQIAKEQAKAEIKEEMNANRTSLKANSTNAKIEEEKNMPRMNIRTIIEENNKNTKNLNEKMVNPQTNIEEIINNSFELYNKKELEKTRIRLEKAKKDSQMAYYDLRDCLNQGLSILDAIKNIQQKYRNEDTINFATLLFARDILNIKLKDEQILSLENENSQKEKEKEKLMEEITKREDTISKLKGTIQLKINEMTQMKMNFEEENKILQENVLKLEELERYSQEQDESIEDLNTENQELSEENKQLSKEKIKLESENDFLKNEILSYKQKINDLIDEFKSKEENFEIQSKEFYKLQAMNEIFDEKENSYKETIKELKEKNEKLENKINNMLEDLLKESKQNISNSELDLKNNKEQHKKRSKDILGEI